MSVPPEQTSSQPSQATIYRWLKELHYRVIGEARDGKSKTDLDLRTANGGVQVTKILERIEIDHTPLDILVICKKTQLILGRPWLTLAVDRFSRMIMGFYIGFHSPSQTSILYCLRQAVLPKDHILEKFPDIKGTWPAKGLIDTLVMDNGMDFHGNSLESVALEIGMTLHYCGVAMPYMKGAVERLLGTLNRNLIHQLPGTTFSNVAAKGSYDSEKHAAIDLETLTHIILKWIVDDYHNTPHRALKGITPLQKWQAAESSTLIELPAFPRQMDAMVGYEGCRTLFHYGLQYDNLNYNSPVLHALFEKHPKNRIDLTLKAYEHDVSFISIFHPELDEYVDIPAVDKSYVEGLNRYVHRMICAEVRKRFTDKWTQQQLIEVKTEIQAIVAAAVTDKKTQTRKNAAKHQLLNSEAIWAEKSSSSLKAACVPVNPQLPQDDEMALDLSEDVPVFSKSIREPAFA